MKSDEPQETKNPAPKDSHFAKSPESPPDSIAPSIPLQPNDILSFRVANGDVSPVSEAIQSIAKVKNPRKVWMQTHPDRMLWNEFHLYRTDGDDGVYVVAAPMVSLFGNLANTYKLIPWISTEGVVAFWPIKCGPSAENCSWSTSAMAVANSAAGEWRTLISNRNDQIYTARRPVNPCASPTWPKNEEIIRLLAASFADRVITTPEHPAFKKFEMS